MCLNRHFKLEVCCINTSLQSLLRDTEYYDYGHGEAQDSSYEPYGKTIWSSTSSLTEGSYQAILAEKVTTYACLCFLLLVLTAQDEWDNSWSGSGAGGKVPPTRPMKGSYRDHPYGRF